jgi:hypothetical protein
VGERGSGDHENRLGDVDDDARQRNDQRACVTCWMGGRWVSPRPADHTPRTAPTAALRYDSASAT